MTSLSNEVRQEEERAKGKNPFTTPCKKDTAPYLLCDRSIASLSLRRLQPLQRITQKVYDAQKRNTSPATIAHYTRAKSAAGEMGRHHGNKFRARFRS